jgi:DNA-binding MarR family transcriptional regulator
VRPVSAKALTAKAEAIERIMAAHRGMTYAFASARSGPLLAANLTMSQLKVLLVLARHGDTDAADGAAGQELTAALHVGLATVTGIVDRLVAQGLVERREDPHDRRIRRVTLTSAGRDLAEAIIMAGGEHQRRILDRLDIDQLAIVEQAFQLLLDASTAEAAAESKVNSRRKNENDDELATPQPGQSHC